MPDSCDIGVQRGVARLQALVDFSRNVERMPKQEAIAELKRALVALGLWQPQDDQLVADYLSGQCPATGVISHFSDRS